MSRSVREIAVVILLIGGGLLILFSGPKGSRHGPVLEALYTVVRPVRQAAASATERVTAIHRRYLALVGLSEENQALKKEISELKRERTLLLNAETENRRLKKLLDLKSRHEFPSLVAQVIGGDVSGWYRTLLINRGSADGVALDMPVTVAEGVVGRISRTSSDMSQVLLVTDPKMSADCRVSRSRARGVLTGSLNRGLVLRYLEMKSDVKAGDEVLTTGLDGVFPKGLSVGRVQSVNKGPQDLFLEARVIPSVDFGGLEEVVVILGHAAGFDLQTGLDDKR